MADPNASPHDVNELMGHVKDSHEFHVAHDHVAVPQVRDWEGEGEIITIKTGFGPVDEMIEPLDLKTTKFMVLEVVAAIIIAAVFISLANRLKSGKPPKGRIWNMFEAMLLFIRNEVARPAIGRHDADKFLPFLWTAFFFVLICNLLGMVPWAGSPTGAFAVTAVLALTTFGVVLVAGMTKMGPIGFWVGQVPHMDLPGPLAILLKPMIFAIEVLGLCIKHFVLSVRLMANIMAGHLVLAAILAFIAIAANIDHEATRNAAVAGIGATSVFGAVALSLLELFVAFLQAYIFAFLSALFIGMAVHPH